MSVPGHATVNSKVERVGQTDESVDDEYNVLGDLVVHEGVETEGMCERLRECSSDLLERVCRAVMTMRGISVDRNTPITTTSIRVVLCASRCRAYAELLINKSVHIFCYKYKLYLKPLN